MEKKYLIINLGSESKKYALWQNDQEIFSGHFEKKGNDFVFNFNLEVNSGVHKIFKSSGRSAQPDIEYFMHPTIKKQRFVIQNGLNNKIKISVKDFNNSLNFLFNFLKQEKIILNEKEITVMGIRVVAPGIFFRDDHLVDSLFIKKLEFNKEMAMLHIEPVLQEIKIIKKNFKNISLVAISDSHFHQTISADARNYALPLALIKKFEIYRYGYHGISLASIVANFKEKFGIFPRRTIICHLGGGSSITALKNGESTDTSMGFSPLEGVPMMTRVGNVDIEAIFYLMKKNKIKAEKMLTILNQQSGLFGLSGGQSKDLRVLLERGAKGNKKAKLAVENFVYNIKKYIGAYIAILGGLDLLIFSGAIGERSSIIRARICENLEFLDLGLDKEKNNLGLKNKESLFFLHSKKSKVKILVAKNDENKEIYQRVLTLLGK